ncbi:MAG: efflux RND transporter periplasmic adaptor subunit [Planctomycetota bacterium]|nr:MAG: efflux RND transporter periplasmic adaptor subunit [Planctomycetota bacterium]REJ92120.1 MAG: efflux RND transporter periplasmic adaptor subunit [Planctomycetota bacterium]REK28656.1 MAG: efflux RND transporter periplasmic adaptor subunit [Planctomycetota bacterium]REK39270.1 MAG: efflux RND transporter periplasmic adaptor subunit [Planctomycetota bacterium]
MSTKTNDTETHTHEAIHSPPESQASACDHEGNGEAATRPAEVCERPAAESESTEPQRRWSVVGWVTRTIPTLLVMGALAGLGYFGHHHGWKIPKFSELAGHGEVEGVQWCEEHGVPEAECIACNADLMPKGELYGWCKEHGVHECVLHHPETAQLSEVPEISQEDFERAARAIALRPRTKNDPACKMHLRRIQFPSKAAADKAGIDIGLVDRGPVVESVTATGEVVYDPTRVARLASRAGGTVWRVDKNVGDQVKEGEVLALVDAVEVGRAKAELLQAVAQLQLHDKTLKRLAGLEGVVAGKRVLEAEAARTEAEAAVRKSVQTMQNLGLPIALEDIYQQTDSELARQLQFLGLPKSVSADLGSQRITANLIPLVAPRDGIVVSRDVVAGEVIDTTRTLFTIADTSHMWLVLNVPLEEAKRVAAGQKVIFIPDGDDHPHTGKLTWISSDVDAETRTVKVRGELPNEDSHLRNETFGAGEIVLREEDDAIIVPSDAIHWEGCCHVAFVRDKDYMKKGSYKVFHTRSVRPGVQMGDTTEMIAGLLPGEVVVTKGSGVLRAELLKGNLGAG